MKSILSSSLYHVKAVSVHRSSVQDSIFTKNCSNLISLNCRTKPFTVSCAKTRTISNDVFKLITKRQQFPKLVALVPFLPMVVISMFSPYTMMNGKISNSSDELDQSMFPLKKGPLKA